ncbi:MAG: hypothetical protein KF834_01390 [Burkholderiales bacterium]|nr:hypothetical protein [Burkholderiales bacterium]
MRRYAAHPMGIDWRKHWWKPGFTLAFFTVGVPFWLIPYNKVNLPDALLGPGLVVVLAAAVLARGYSGKSFLRSALVMGLAVPAAVMARVIVEVAQRPASHNLWPLELVIAALAGTAAGVAGALLGSLLLWANRRGHRDRELGNRK